MIQITVSADAQYIFCTSTQTATDSHTASTSRLPNSFSFSASAPTISQTPSISAAANLRTCPHLQRNRHCSSFDCAFSGLNPWGAIFIADVSTIHRSVSISGSGRHRVPCSESASHAQALQALPGPARRPRWTRSPSHGTASVQVGLAPPCQLEDKPRPDRLPGKPQPPRPAAAGRRHGPPLASGLSHGTRRRPGPAGSRAGTRRYSLTRRLPCLDPVAHS